MKHQIKGTKSYFTIGLFALLVLATLALVLVGSRVYGLLVSGQNANSTNRIVKAYLSSQIRAADREHGVSFANGPEGQALVLREVLETGTYEVRIYLYEGNLMEEYAIAGTDFTPIRANIVAKTNQFDIENPEPNLLKIITGEGEIYMSLRSDNGILGGIST